MRLAHEVMTRTRIYRLLEGYRDHPKAALDTIADTLIRSHSWQLTIRRSTSWTSTRFSPMKRA